MKNQESNEIKKENVLTELVKKIVGTEKLKIMSDDEQINKDKKRSNLNKKEV